MPVLLVGLTLALAFANGANDVSKGIATLVGSGVGDYRRAVLWGTLWTVAGAVAAAYATQGLVEVFSGKGLLTTPQPGGAFLLAVVVGAIGWLLIATTTGMPVSTTHALVGGLVGSAMSAAGVSGVQWATVAHKVALPLALSPLLALGLLLAAGPGLQLAFRRLNRYCACVERAEPVLVPLSRVAALAEPPGARVRAGADCPPDVITRLNLMDSLHWLTAGLTSFARGLNDTPKIVAVGVAAAAMTGMAAQPFYLLTGAAMGLGSYIAGRRVTDTLAGRVTRIAPDDGFAGNLFTSTLVGLASLVAAPVSTTHVSTGAIVGIGVRKRDVRWRMVRDVAVAWLVTLPVAAVIAAAVRAIVP